MFKRKPDFIIGKFHAPYLLRWWLIPRNRFLNIYLHKFLQDDEDRALHDHPWASISIILKGGYKEHLPGGIIKLRKAPRITFRKASQAHRIELHRKEIGTYVTHQVIVPAWTIFITGAKIREWGFLCPKGWRHWRDFTNPDNPGEIGKGCNN